jgi:hypothetical protein
MAELGKLKSELFYVVNDFIEDKSDALDCVEKCLSMVEKYAIGFSDWQRELVFTDKDIWLKEKTTKELYDLYLETL